MTLYDVVVARYAHEMRGQTPLDLFTAWNASGAITRGNGQ